MASFDTGCYEQCLCALLDGDAATRTQGEQFLAAAEQTRLSELLAALCAVLASAHAAPCVRQLACIVLKNLVRAHWDAASKRFAPPLVAPDARAGVRAAALGALGAPDSKLRTAAAAALCEILCWDWPAAWPSAVADLVACAQDRDRVRARGALAALDQFLAAADVPEGLLGGLTDAVLPAALGVFRRSRAEMASASASTDQSAEAGLCALRAVGLFLACVQHLAFRPVPRKVAAGVLARSGAWLAELGALLAAPPAPGDVALRVCAANALSLLLSNFGTAMRTYSAELVPRLWHALRVTIDAYCVIAMDEEEEGGGGNNMGGMTATAQEAQTETAAATATTLARAFTEVTDEEGNTYGVEDLLEALLQCFVPLCEKKAYRAAVVPVQDELAGALLRAMQLTGEQARAWAAGPAAFVAQESEDPGAARVRPAAQAVLETLAGSSDRGAASGLRAAAAGLQHALVLLQVVCDGAQPAPARARAARTWWRLREACLAAVADLADSIVAAADTAPGVRAFAASVLRSLPHQDFALLPCAVDAWNSSPSLVGGGVEGESAGFAGISSLSSCNTLSGGATGTGGTGSDTVPLSPLVVIAGGAAGALSAPPLYAGFLVGRALACAASLAPLLSAGETARFLAVACAVLREAPRLAFPATLGACRAVARALDVLPPAVAARAAPAAVAPLVALVAAHAGDDIGELLLLTLGACVRAAPACVAPPADLVAPGLLCAWARLAPRTDTAGAAAVADTLAALCALPPFRPALRDRVLPAVTDVLAHHRACPGILLSALTVLRAVLDNVGNTAELAELPLRPCVGALTRYIQEVPACDLEAVLCFRLALLRGRALLPAWPELAELLPPMFAACLAPGTDEDNALQTAQMLTDVLAVCPVALAAAIEPLLAALVRRVAACRQPENRALLLAVVAALALAQPAWLVDCLARTFSPEQLSFVFSQWVSLHPILRRFGPYWTKQSALALLALFSARSPLLDSLSVALAPEHSSAASAASPPAPTETAATPFPVACLHVVCQEFQHNQVTAHMFPCSAVQETQTPTATPSSSFDGDLADVDAYKHLLGDDSQLATSMHSYEDDDDDDAENNEETDDQDKPFIESRPLYTLDFNVHVTARLRELLASDMAPYLKQVYFQLCPDDKKVIEGILLQTRS